ncbi:YueI family protein [Lacticaseibacillus nasuensis]|uniref:YueI family protein n=1 Tax=Lacticaseibacillus nasuensis TaxID=944671 RepID=UPI00224592F0|nr:YueI family protein [Lacticaseibacillus nasuensis]MCX2456095.1 YueI family protein [Lacticaseibacillus nasuensis]
MAEEQSDLQSHLSAGLYGTPQTNPDERRHYLGSLRERCALVLTNADLQNAATLAAFTKALPQYQHRDLKLLLNGKLPSDVTTPYLTLATKAALPFTLVNDDTAQLGEQAVGLLLVAPTAINQADVNLPQPPAAPKKKPGLFDRLFD